MKMKPRVGRAALLMSVLTSVSAPAQNVGAPATQGPPGVQGSVAAFPGRTKAAPEIVARGKAAYNTNCAYCHGQDARGGENGGSNLLRSDITMKDRDGSMLREFLQNPKGTQHSGVREGVLKFKLTPEQAAEISAFLRDFPLNSRDPGRMRPPTILVGDAKAGEAYFAAKCASCHSVAGDLKEIGTRIGDPRMLQQTWLMPVVSGRGGTPRRAGVPPITVTVTEAGGNRVEGTLGRIDDFIVTLTQADGTERSFQRDGNSPGVELHDPMQPHRDLLPLYTDRDIHDVTAFLATVQ